MLADGSAGSFAAEPLLREKQTGSQAFLPARRHEWDKLRDELYGSQ